MKRMKINIKLKYSTIYFINVIAILIYMIFSVIFIINQDAFKGFSVDGLHNNFCQEEPNNTICKNKYKKKKLFYILIDGVAYDQLYELRKKDKYNITRIFRGITTDYKQSAVNFQIMFGGKINRNFIGKPMNEDNIFYNLFINGMKFTFRGIKLVIYGLAGKYFDKYKITPTEKDSMDTMCDFGIDIHDKFTENLINRISDSSGYFKEGYDKEYLYQELDNHFRNELNIVNERGENDFMTKCLKEKFKYTGEESIVYYGNKIDHINHSYDKNHIRVVLQMYLTEKVLIRCINWCWDHPEYAFFYASDHGGQNFYGEDNIMNHGYNTLGNEAGFLGWTKELAENYEKLKLDDKIVSLYDLSTLVPQIMEGGVIPLESAGVPHPFANDTLLYITSIKSKTQQLLKYIELFVNKYPKNKKILEKYNDTLKYIYNTDEKILLEAPDYYLDELRNMNIDIDDLIDKNNQNKIFTIAFYIVFLFLGLIILYDIYILKNIVKTNIYLFGIVIIFGLYFSIICIFLYPTNIIYKKLYITTINQYYSFSFVILCYIIFNYTKISQNALFYSIFVVLFIFISLIGTLFYTYEIFTKMKRFFTNIFLAKISDFFIFFPLFGFYMAREIKKLKGFYFDAKFKLDTYIIFLINSIFIFVFMIIFEILLPRNFEVHTILTFIVNFIVFLFLLFFFVSCFLKYYPKNDKHSLDLGSKVPLDGLPLIKLFLMLYQFYLSDEAERALFLFIIIPLLEFISSNFLRKEKIWKLILLISFMGLGEIFYLITQRYYSFDISIKVVSRTIVAMTAEDSPIFSGILMGTHKLRYLMLLQGYLLSLSRFYKTKEQFFTETSFMIRLVPFMQLIGKIIYFYFRYFRNLVGEEFLELFMWTMFHVIMFGIDIICLSLFEISNRIYIFKKSEIKLQEEVKNDSDLKINNTSNTKNLPI